MIRHYRYSLDEHESKIVADYVIPLIGLAHLAVERLFVGPDDGPQRHAVGQMVERIEGRFGREQYANYKGNDEYEEIGRRYSTPWDMETIRELRAVAELVMNESLRQSDPAYWTALGMPHADDLGMMRMRTCQQIADLTDRLDNGMREYAEGVSA